MRRVMDDFGMNPGIFSGFVKVESTEYVPDKWESVQFLGSFQHFGGILFPKLVHARQLVHQG
jgi:hypothetical protein